MAQTIKGLIMVRSGSERVINKNIRPFAGSSLLEIKIRQLQRIKSLDGIVVNSNDNAMLELARSHGCEIVKRDPYYATSEIPAPEVDTHVAEHFPGDILVVAHTTAPLIRDETIEKCIQAYKGGIGQYDSVNTVHLVKEFLFLDGQPINYDKSNRPRSQDLPDIMSINNAISISSREDTIKNRTFLGNRPNLFLIDKIEGMDIDYPLDFEIAEFLFTKMCGIDH